jgi:segregation and condensation protein B
MNWRQFWQATLANVRALFGAPVPPPPPPATLDAANRPRRLLLPPPPDAQIIDLARGSVEPPQAPLRRRPQIHPIGDISVETPPAAAVEPVGQRRARFASAEDAVVVVQASDRFDDLGEPPSRAQAAPFLHHPGDHSIDPPADRLGEAHGPLLPQAGLLPGPSVSRPRADGAASPHDPPQDSAQAGADATEGADPLPLSALLESLLFVAAEPVDPNRLARSLQLPPTEIERGLAQLAADLQGARRGLRLQRFKGSVQLVTAPAAASTIESFLDLETSTKLSGPALEALAVIAYRQPVTRAQIEAVRGVDCAGVLRSLVQRGLVAEVGRLESVGRPILYGVTELFMQHFGLVEMDQLPPLEETEADRLWAATVLAEEEGRTDTRNRPGHESGHGSGHGPGAG